MNIQGYMNTLQARNEAFIRFYNTGVSEDAENFPAEQSVEEWDEQFATFQSLEGDSEDGAEEGSAEDQDADTDGSVDDDVEQGEAADVNQAA